MYYKTNLKEEGITVLLQEGGMLVPFLYFPSSLSSVVSVPNFLLTHMERLHVMGCGLKGKLVRLLSMGVGFHYGRNKIITSIARRVAARLATAIRNKAVNDAKELCATGQCAIAVVRLQCAINFWHLPSIAHMAWLLIDGREGVARDTLRAYELAEKGFLLGSKDCKGVLAKFYMFGYRVKYDAKRSLELARESSDEGSRYGHCVLANLHELGMGGLQQDYSKAIAFYRLAAEQALDTAQCELGLLLMRGCSECLYDDGLPWLQLAADQRNPKACFWLGDYYEDDSIVEVSKTEAIKWYLLAQAAGHPCAADAMQRLQDRK